MGRHGRLLAHPEVSDEPDEDTTPQTLGSSSSSSSPSQSNPATTSEAPKESEEGKVTMVISIDRKHEN